MIYGGCSYLQIVATRIAIALNSKVKVESSLDLVNSWVKKLLCKRIMRQKRNSESSQVFVMTKKCLYLVSNVLYHELDSLQHFDGQCPNLSSINPEMCCNILCLCVYSVVDCDFKKEIKQIK